MTIMGAKILENEAIKRLDDAGFVLADEYVNYKTPTKIQCKKHPQYIVNLSVQNFLVKKFCPYCSLEAGKRKGVKIPYNIIAQDFEKAGYELLTTQDEYVNAIQDLRCICKKHGEILLSYGHLAEGRICPHCSKERYIQSRKLSKEYVKEKLEERGFIWLDEEYKNLTTPLHLSCKYHQDKDFYLTFSHIYHSHTKCPYCHQSSGEKEVMRILDKYNVKYDTQIRIKDLYRYYGQYLSYDFYIPHLNMFIEYQGQFHDQITNWSSEEHLFDQKERDKMKADYAKKNNYRLLEIWYYDFDNIEDILIKEGVIKV